MVWNSAGETSTDLIFFCYLSFWNKKLNIIQTFLGFQKNLNVLVYDQ